MKLTIMENSFNSYGRSVVFKPLEALVYLEAKDFGSALSETILTLQFNCSLPFEQQKVNRSLRSSYDKFIHSTDKPKRTFRRKKAELDISTKANFVSSEEFFPRSKDDYKTRNETYFRDWNLHALNILKTELGASKNKFKSTDDFDFAACLAWLNSLSEKLPKTKREADILIDSFEKGLAVERSKLSDWELLGEDWSDYHATAREVVPFPELWSITNDLAPNGNDTGADVIHFFQEKKSKILKSRDKGKTIFTREWESMWGEPIPEPNGNYDDLALNDYRKFVVGFAFSFLKNLGHCPEWLKMEAVKHIRANEEFTEREYSKWEYMGEFKTINKIMVSCLEKAPS